MNFKTRIIPLLLPLTFFCACSSMVTRAPDFDLISMGMRKEEVIQQLGKPTSSSAISGTEYLVYEAGRGVISGWRTDPNMYDNNTYFVRLINGRVESYGKVGDFETTRQPASRVDVNIRHN